MKKTQAAVLLGARPFELMELVLDGPRDCEVLVRFSAAVYVGMSAGLDRLKVARAVLEDMGI